MIRVTFDKAHVYETASATEFLNLYAMMNHYALYPPLVSIEGARNLLALRAVLNHGAALDLSLNDDDFVRAAAEVGMFMLEDVNELEKPSGLPQNGSTPFLRST